MNIKKTANIGVDLYVHDSTTVSFIWWGVGRGRPQIIFQGRQRQHFASPCQVADDAIQTYVHETLNLFYTPTPQRKRPMLPVTDLRIGHGLGSRAFWAQRNSFLSRLIINLKFAKLHNGITSQLF